MSDMTVQDLIRWHQMKAKTTINRKKSANHLASYELIKSLEESYQEVFEYWAKAITDKQTLQSQLEAQEKIAGELAEALIESKKYLKRCDYGFDHATSSVEADRLSEKIGKALTQYNQHKEGSDARD